MKIAQEEAGSVASNPAAMQPGERGPLPGRLGTENYPIHGGSFDGHEPGL